MSEINSFQPFWRLLSRASPMLISVQNNHFRNISSTKHNYGSPRKHRSMVSHVFQFETHFFPLSSSLSIRTLKFQSRRVAPQNTNQIKVALHFLGSNRHFHSQFSVNRSSLLPLLHVDGGSLRIVWHHRIFERSRPFPWLRYSNGEHPTDFNTQLVHTAHIHSLTHRHRNVPFSFSFPRVPFCKLINRPLIFYSNPS